ncbi:DUF397 domain-containing protein [Streptomyces sp. NPDC003016]
MKHEDRQGVDLGRAAWRKSSYSGDQGNCVEVADGFAGVVPVRDSKVQNGPALIFPVDQWRTFISAVKSRRSL